MYIDSVERDEEEEVIKKVYEKPNENWEVNILASEHCNPIREQF